MITETADGFDTEVRTDGGQLFPQETDIDLDVVFHGVGVKTPDAREQRFLGEIAAAGLEKETHDIKLPRREPNGLIGAAERTGGEIERCIPEGERVYLRALPPQQRADARELLELTGASPIFEISAKTGEGVEALAQWLGQRIQDWKQK